jgi:hypothetical protein
MVTKRHKKGRLSSEIDRNRVRFAKQNKGVRKRRKLMTHRINYYAINNNIAQDGTQLFIYNGDFEEE